MHDVPTILVQLQDDLARSRKREAFWMSVVVHLVLVILIWNSPKFEKYFPHRQLDINPKDWMKQKDLTYLALPPDAQKVPKRPNTNILSDKDRIATTRTPHLDTKELQKILDASRPGPPGPAGVPQPSSPAPPAVAQSAPAQQPQAPQRQPADDNQMAQLQSPPATTPRPNFNTGPMTPGAAIAEAARAAASSTRGTYGGSGGDYGLGQGRKATGAIGPIETLSDTMGVDFGPYLSRVVYEVRRNWITLIPESAMMRKGKVSIEFVILKDGKVTGMQLAPAGTSGDVALDRAAWGGITASNPFPPLPSEFPGQYLSLRFTFYYNPDKSDLLQ